MLRSIKEYALNFYWAVLNWVYFHPRAHHRLASHREHRSVGDGILTPGDRLAVQSTSSFVPNTDPQAVFLRYLLRKAPYWRNGHLMLGELALIRGEWLLAYSSAQAALQLDPESPLAFSLRGKCALRTGASRTAAYDLERARALFGARHNRDWAKCLRELAAAYMALGEHERAAQILDELPVALRDPATAAARAFAMWKGRQPDAH